MTSSPHTCKLKLQVWIWLALIACASVSQGVAAQQSCSSDTVSMDVADFHENGDGTVTDLETGLMWMRCSSGQQWLGQRCIGFADAHGWLETKQYADKVNRDGEAFFNDWRVPTLRELATITDRGCVNPRTNLSVFPDTPAAPFWSSTPRPGESSGVRFLALSFGVEGVVLARKDERFHVRLVRTGP
jgi:hypothetical protein